MMTTEGWQITQTDPHRHKYADAMAEYLGCKSLDWADEDGGDSECPTGHFARFGRRILFTDDRGFVWCERYDDAAGAKAMFRALDNYYGIWADEYYGIWADEDSDLSDVARMLMLDQADRYLAYTLACIKDACLPHDWNMWLALEEPAGPLG